jgi:hypothetical protein
MIPKIHHLFWATPTPLPQKLQEYRASWCRNNPKWHSCLWTLEDVLTMAKDLSVVFEMLKHPDLHWVLKSDIARWVILWRCGGVYSDTDVECLKPMDCFLDNVAFCGRNMKPDGISNCVVGAVKGNAHMLSIAIGTAQGIADNFEDANKTIIGYGARYASKMLEQCPTIYPEGHFAPIKWSEIRYGTAKPSSAYPDAYCVHYYCGLDKDGWVRQTIMPEKKA